MSNPSPGGSSERRAPPSLSLPQILVVLLALAGLAALAIPLWFGRPEVSLERAVLLFADDLREVQDRALFRHEGLQVVLLPEGAGYEVRDMQDQAIPARLGPGPFRREYARDAVFRGIRMRPLEGAAEGRLRYDRLGFLLDPAKIELSYAGARRILELSEQSGAIAIDGVSIELGKIED